MRLIKVPRPGSAIRIEFEDIIGQSTESYGILSHTWDIEEVTYADVVHQAYEHLQGYAKIRFGLRQAQNNGFRLLWVDTCCIDKSSSAELSEAINSMYTWYSQAACCYAILQDVTHKKHHPDFRKQFLAARWFTRGWTLQELLAPDHVDFFNKYGERIDSKLNLSKLITEATNIQNEYIMCAPRVRAASVARRLSWASSRQTTRIEDIAYCLIGLMDVNMPMLYGEGGKAFLRLQEEIMKVSDDQTLFLWRNDTDREGRSGLLASSPKAFKSSGHFAPFVEWEQRSAFQMTNRGLQIELNLYSMRGNRWMATFDCPHKPAIYLEKLNARSNQYARVETQMIETDSLGTRNGTKTTICVPQELSIIRHSAVAYWPVRFRIINHTTSTVDPTASTLRTAYAIDASSPLHDELANQSGRHDDDDDSAYTSAIEIPCKAGVAMKISFILNPGSPRQHLLDLLIGVRSRDLAFEVIDRSTGTQDLPFSGKPEGSTLFKSKEHEIVMRLHTAKTTFRIEFLCDIVFSPPQPTR